MNKETPMVDSEYLLQKFSGKGGWTYAEIPEIDQNKNSPFGWVKVKGWVDDFELNQYKLMPMGNGKLFLPVKAEIRRQIKKQAGDFVRVVLFLDRSDYQIPDEIVECFKNEDKTLSEAFLNFTEGEQKSYIDWIYDAKTDETKVKRIARMMDRLGRKLRLHDSER